MIVLGGFWITGMMVPMSNRRQYTQQEREHWLAQFDQTDSTAISFCREHQLCYQTFLRWRRAKRESNRAGNPDFVEIEVPGAPVAPPAAPRVELTFPGGLTLCIHSSAPIQR